MSWLQASPAAAGLVMGQLFFSLARPRGSYGYACDWCFGLALVSLPASRGLILLTLPLSLTFKWMLQPRSGRQALRQSLLLLLLSAALWGLYPHHGLLWLAGAGLLYSSLSLPAHPLEEKILGERLLSALAPVWLAGGQPWAVGGVSLALAWSILRVDQQVRAQEQSTQLQSLQLRQHELESQLLHPHSSPLVLQAERQRQVARRSLEQSRGLALHLERRDRLSANLVSQLMTVQPQEFASVASKSLELWFPDSQVQLGPGLPPQLQGELSSSSASLARAWEAWMSLGWQNCRAQQAGEAMRASLRQHLQPQPEQLWAEEERHWLESLPPSLGEELCDPLPIAAWLDRCHRGTVPSQLRQLPPQPGGRRLGLLLFGLSQDLGEAELEVRTLATRLYLRWKGTSLSHRGAFLSHLAHSLGGQLSPSPQGLTLELPRA